MDTQLSDPQRTIIEFPPSHDHVLVIAAPGSGKTRVITERVGYLLEQRLVDPEQIVVMTFTEKAAKELLDRLSERLSSAVQGVQVGTIHTICNHLLESYAAVVGLKPTFKIYDALRQEDALRVAAANAGHALDDRRQLLRIKEAISRRKRHGLTAGEQRAQPPFDDVAVLATDQAYRQLLKENDALDFDDLILKATELFTRDQDAATQIHRALRYIFVDEFHDLSPEQFAFLTMLVPPTMPDRQVVVVADPNQIAFLFPTLKSTVVEKFEEALGRVGLRVYAPRAKRFLEAEEPTLIIGLLTRVLGKPPRNEAFDRGEYGEFHSWLDSATSVADALMESDPTLRAFVDQRVVELSAIKRDFAALKTVLDTGGWTEDAAYDPSTHKRALLNAPSLSADARRALGGAGLEKLYRERLAEENLERAHLVATVDGARAIVALRVERPAPLHGGEALHRRREFAERFESQPPAEARQRVEQGSVDDRVLAWIRCAG